MPPIMLATRVSLHELVDLAIGTPELGAVNFTALHTLLMSMLKVLNLQDATIDYQPVLAERGRSMETVGSLVSTAPPMPPREKELRQTVSGMPSALDTKVQDIVSQVEHISHPGVLDQEALWGDKDMMMGTGPAEPWKRKNLEGWEETATPTTIPSILESPTKAKIGPQEDMRGPQAKHWKDIKDLDPEETKELLQNLVEEMKTLKEAQRAQKVPELPELQPLDLLQRIEKIEKLLEDRDAILEQIGQRMNSITGGEDATMVTWEDLEQAINDGWKASQLGSELSTDVSKRRMSSSIDISTVPTGKVTSTDQAMGAAGVPHVPSEKAIGKQLGRASSAVAPGQEQPPQALDEAGGPQPQKPPVAQADHRKAREPSATTHLRRDEQDAHPGANQQDLSLARQPQPYAQPDQQARVPIGLSQVYQRPDQPRLGAPSKDQLGRPSADAVRPHRGTPHTLGHPGMLPPQIGAQGFVTPGMDQIGMIPSVVPGSDQVGLQLPGIDQFDMVPLGAYQPGMAFPGMGQQAAMQESGRGVLGMDQSGLITMGIDQNGFVMYGTDEQRLVPLGTDQYGRPLPLTDQYAFMPPGLMPTSVDQQGFTQPSLEASGFIQPGTGGDLVQAGEDQGGLVQPGTGKHVPMPPGAGQPGLVQSGAYLPSMTQLGPDQDGLVQSGTGLPGLMQPGAYPPSLVQPGAVPRGLVQPGTVHYGLAQPGAAQLGLVPAGRGQPGLMLPGTYPPDLVQPGVVLPRAIPRALVQPGAVLQGLVPPGAVPRGLVQPGAEQLGVVQPGTEQVGVVQPGAVPHGVMQPSAEQVSVVQPGAEQVGGVQPSAVPHGVVPPSAEQAGVQPGAVPRGVVQPSAVPRGVVQPGAEQLGMVLPGAIPFGMPPGVVPRGLVQPGAELLGMVQPGAERLGFVQPGAVPRGFVQPGAVPRGFVQPGAVPQGFVQPGAVPGSVMQPSAEQLDQHGLVQPGADQIQPDADQSDSVQIDADQQGMVQIGAVPRGLGQPGAVPRGLGQPVAVQRGLMQLGAVPRGLVQPGAGPQGLVQPATDQRGLVQPDVDQIQPGAHQSGFVQTGADQHGMVQIGRVPRSVGQPGAVQHGLQPGADPSGLVEPGVDQTGFVYPEMDQDGLIQLGEVPSGRAQAGAYSPEMMQPGMYPGTDPHSWVQPGIDQHGLVQPRADQHGLGWPSTAQQYLVQPGTGQPGLSPLGQFDWTQPEMDQRGLVQPGADESDLAQSGIDQPSLESPGAVEPGLEPPGGVQRGLEPPGAVQHGLVPPGAGQHGLVPPSAVQRGVWQPGMYPPGLALPGAVQPGFRQPGMYPHGLTPLGADQRGLVPPGADQGDLVQAGRDQGVLVPPGVDQSGLMQPGTDQGVLMQPGAAQPALVPPGTARPALAPPGAARPGLVPPGEARPGLVPPGTVRPGLVPPGIARPGLAPPGAARPGLMPPGIAQPGLVPPGAAQLGLVPPGAARPGLVQPGMYPHGLVPPGAAQRGLMQPGTYPRVFIPRGVAQRGLMQPGMYPRAFIPRGAAQRGLMQPGMYPRGLVPAGMDQRSLEQVEIVQDGLVPPVMERRGLVPPRPSQQHSMEPERYPQGWVRPGIDQSGSAVRHHAQKPTLAPYGTYPPGLVQPGLREFRTDQRGVMARDTEHRDFPASQTDSGLDQPTVMQKGPEAVVLVQQNVAGQSGLDLTRQSASVQGGLPLWTIPSLDARSRDAVSYLQRRSSERMEGRSDRQDSLDKLAPFFPMAVETFRLLGELIGLYMEFKESMKELKDEEAGQTEMEKLQYMISVMIKKKIPDNLDEQLKSIRILAKEIKQEKIKLDRLQRLVKGDIELGEAKELKTNQLGLQLGILRVTVADIEKELAELKESQERGKATMENSVSEASLYLQEQLDKLRTIIENMLASSSTLLSMSIAPEKPRSHMMPGHVNLEATCPACSLDVSHQVSMLVQRYEQLQDMVNNLASTRPSKRVKLQSQDEELLGHVQSAILQVQGDCEKLNITTSNLIDDHRQKQKEIDELYQGIQKLEREKANREHLEMEIDVKADKSALASKVSRIQFDATTEQLNQMMQELVAKMSGKEQDWKKMLDKLLSEMDNKLDRLELDPVKQSLEDRWKSLRQQLRERSPLYQSDEAAAMRRQLLAHFHCLSCDRPLETPVTGQTIPVTPMGPSLPKHRSLRPYTVYELEQIRQQSRNLKLGTPFARGDQMDRSVGRLRSMHSKMLMDIEKVQIHFGGSVKASSQMIRELLQAQCLNQPCYKRLPEADYTYSTTPRRCGGSHTITSPYRRNRLQHLQGLIPHEDIQITMKHNEVDILGLDGHIYKGRMDTRLPDILAKDSFSKVQLANLSPLPGSGMPKHKPRLSRPHVSRQQSLSNSQLPSRPHSAQLSADNSVSSKQQEERPVSSEGRLSQLSFPDIENLQEDPQRMPMRLGRPRGNEEEFEEPTRGPRSSTTPSSAGL
ncbi:glutamine-rich protein 2 [Thomomys bottae]